MPIYQNIDELIVCSRCVSFFKELVQRACFLGGKLPGWMLIPDSSLKLPYLLPAYKTSDSDLVNSTNYGF